MSPRWATSRWPKASGLLARWWTTARRSTRRRGAFYLPSPRAPDAGGLSAPAGAGRRLASAGAELPAVDFPDGSALVLMRDVPALGYLALAESERPPRPVVDDGAALDAQAGAFHLALDSATGAVRSLVGGGKERVNPAAWSGLNQLVYVRGGARSALWTDRSRDYLKAPPELAVAQAQLVAARRERLPGIGVRLVATRRLQGFPSLTSTVTLYDELPWIDVENRLAKTPTLEKEAPYVAFPFALTKPLVEVEVPPGRPGGGRSPPRPPRSRCRIPVSSSSARSPPTTARAWS